MTEQNAPLRGRRVGFLGAGQIGGPMVARLVEAGAAVTVHARRDEARQALAGLGADAVADPGEAVAGRDVVVSCLFSDAQFETLAATVEQAMDAGTVFVSHTTGSPATVRAFGERVRERGVSVVDAPFSGAAQDVLAGTLTVLLGGEPTPVERTEQVVRAYAGTVLRTGGLGSALVLKLLNNLAFAANVQIGLEIVRLGAELGFSTPAVLEALGNASGGTRALSSMGAFADAAEFAAAVAPFLAKDVAVARAVAAELGADLGAFETVLAAGPIDLPADRHESDHTSGSARSHHPPGA